MSGMRDDVRGDARTALGSTPAHPAGNRLPSGSTRTGRTRRTILSRSAGYLRMLGLAVVGLLAVAACGQQGTGTQSGPAAAGQTLKVPIGDDFGTFDPAQTNSETDSEISQNMFNGLVKFDKDLNVRSEERRVGKECRSRWA